MLVFMCGVVIWFFIFDGLADYMVVHHGWMWLRHGGALGELQKQDRENFLVERGRNV